MRKKFPDTKSGNFPECPQTFKSVRKLSKLFLNSQIYWKLSRVFNNFAVSTNFPECMETFLRVQKHYIVPRNFTECAKKFQRSGNFKGCPKTFQGAQKLSKKLQILVTFFYDHTQKTSHQAMLECLGGFPDSRRQTGSIGHTRPIGQKLSRVPKNFQKNCKF